MSQATAADSTAVSSSSSTTTTVLSPHPFSVREVYKAGWLRRSGNTDYRSGPFGRKHDRLWALFCIHDDIQPYLEFYTDPKSSSLHQPLWAATLSHCLHISTSIISSSSSSSAHGIDGGSFDFVIVSSTSSSAGSLRLGAGTREQMNEWVDVLRNRLRDIGVIEPKENLYSPMPEGTKAAAATGNGVIQHSSRDPNSPLPLPPLPQVTTATTTPVPASNTNAAADLLQSLLMDDEPLMEHVTVIAVTNDTNQQQGTANAPAAAVVTVQTMQQQNQNGVSGDQLSPRTTNSVRHQHAGVTRVRIASAPSSMQEALGLDHPLNALALPGETDLQLLPGIDYNDVDDDDDEENSYETIFSTTPGGGVLAAPCSPTRPTPPPTATIPTLPPPQPPVLVLSARQGQSSSLTIVEHPPVIRTASSRPPTTHFHHHPSSQQQQRSREGLRRTVSVGPAEQQQPRSMPILLPASASASRRRGEGLVLFQPPAPPLPTNSPLFRGPPPVSLIAPLIAASPPALQPVSTNHGGAAAASSGPGDGGSGYSLKERQVQRLRMEIQHPAGVRIVLKKKDCNNTIALIDALGTVWVGGWRQKEKPLLYNVFHIGDQIVRVGHCNVTSSADIQRLLKADGSTQIEFIVRRVPFGRVFHLRREADGQPVGIVTDLSSEVREVVAGGLAAQQGVPPMAISPMTMEPCTWTLTEINGRPLNVCSREGEARDRLAAVGRAVTILLQPTDFVTKVIKKGLKGLRGYKDFLLG